MRSSIHVGDSLVCDNYRIDHVDVHIALATKHILYYGARALFMSTTLAEITAFLERQCWQAVFSLPLPVGRWRGQPGGAAQNIMWDYPLTPIRFHRGAAIHAYSHRPSPITGQYVRGAFAPMFNGESFDGRSVKQINISGKITERFTIGRLNILQNRGEKSRLNGDIVQVTGVDFIPKGSIDFFHLRKCGWRNSETSHRDNWLVHLAPVFTPKSGDIKHIVRRRVVTLGMCHRSGLFQGYPIPQWTRAGA